MKVGEQWNEKALPDLVPAAPFDGFISFTIPLLREGGPVFILADDLS